MQSWCETVGPPDWAVMQGRFVTVECDVGLMCRLDVYIYDYLIKRNLQASAKAFLNEGKVSSDPVGTLVLSLWYDGGGTMKARMLGWVGDVVL